MSGDQGASSVAGAETNKESEVTGSSGSMTWVLPCPCFTDGMMRLREGTCLAQGCPAGRSKRVHANASTR